MEAGHSAHTAPREACGQNAILQTLLMGSLVLVVAVIICFSKRGVGSLRKRLGSSKESQEPLLGPQEPQEQVLNNTALNYLTFMRLSAELCATLTVVACVIVVPKWGIQPFELGLTGGHISLAVDGLDTERWTRLWFLGAAYGTVVLVFVQRMYMHMLSEAVDHRTADCLDRTVWLSQLPVRDNLTGMEFLLRDDEFARVEDILKDELEKKVALAVKCLHVCPVVDDWYVLDRKRTETNVKKQRLEEKKAALRSVQAAGCGPSRWWREIKTTFLERRIQKLNSDLDSLDDDLSKKEEGPKPMSGSAFVTLQHAESKEKLFNDANARPFLYWLKSHSFFNFGQAPFSSVTLQVAKATDPEGVHWENLHITRFSRYVRHFLGGGSLLVFMLVVVTPVSISSELQQFMNSSSVFKQRIQKDFGISPGALPAIPEQWAQQLPALIILMINSLFLAILIDIITKFTRNKEVAMDQVDTMILNYLFLVLNQLVIPVLGLSSLPALRELLQARLTDRDDHTSMIQLLHGSMLSYPGIFSIKYLMNCFFFTNSNQMLQGTQHLLRLLSGETKPWIFPWGYWYAYALAVLTSAILLGVLVPSVLPLATVFFALKYQVDKNNFQSQEFRLGPSLGGVLFVRIIFIVRMIVATMWLGVGASVAFALYGEDRDSRCCFFAGSLSLCGLWLWGLSVAKKYMNLHNSKYPTGVPDADRPTLTCGLDSFFQTVFGTFLADAAEELSPSVIASMEVDDTREVLEWDATSKLKNRPSARPPAQLCSSVTQAAALSAPAVRAHSVTSASQPGPSTAGSTVLAGPRTIPGTGLSVIQEQHGT
eukprot:TRINITY_DN27344_c0_g1_i1.p1 TRINITY_DN27344_c0_g1~~TRINITY_DN27344_c0_g1_i1.p1  ORF type:complete len:823 (+),score=130.57 TRINITY_DN27344_c0_g1_i1:56-2524(+)